MEINKKLLLWSLISKENIKQLENKNKLIFKNCGSYMWNYNYLDPVQSTNNQLIEKIIIVNNSFFKRKLIIIKFFYFKKISKLKILFFQFIFMK
jgi:hypothetical protein